MRRLVVRGVMGGVVWVGGGGRRCRAWGPVMGSLVAVAGGGIRGGVWWRGYRRQLAGAGCRVLRPWPEKLIVVSTLCFCFSCCLLLV